MNIFAKYLTWSLAKKLGWKLARWLIKRSENKIDDAILAIKDKIDNNDFNVEKEFDMLFDEIERLRKK